MSGAVFDLARRSRDLELMDTEEVGFAEFRECLAHLEAINRASLAYRPTLAFLDALARRHPGRPLAILDIGFGHGDMLRAIHAWAARKGVAVTLDGVDLSPWAAKAAALATPPDAPIRYHEGDVFDWERPADVMLSSLFAHHLPDEALIRFLRRMEARARLGWFVNDLHRHAIPYAFVRAAAAILPVNRMVKHDAPLSVARAFTREDWRGLIARSRIDASRVRIDWFFPFRWGVGAMR